MEKLLTVAQAGNLLNVHGETVRQWLRSGKLRGVKLGPRSWRVPEAALRELTTVNTSPSPAQSDTPPTGDAAPLSLEGFLVQTETFRARLERQGVSFENADGAELVRAGHNARTKQLMDRDGA